MSLKYLRGSASGKALTLAALLTVAVPGAAYAKTTDVTVVTPGPTMGPPTPFTGVSSHADCPDGLVSGGGADQAIGSDEMSNGNHVMGMVPSADGATEYIDTPGIVGTDATHWMAFGGSGSRSSDAFSTTPYAICLNSNLIRHTQVVMNKAQGPSVGLSSKLVTATCPADTVLIGGGARTTPASVGSLKPIASFPTFNDADHHFGSIAADDGERNPDSWTAVGGIGGGRGADNMTYAYAICSTDEMACRSGRPAWSSHRPRSHNPRLLERTFHHPPDGAPPADDPTGARRTENCGRALMAAFAPRCPFPAVPLGAISLCAPSSSKGCRCPDDVKGATSRAARRPARWSW
ncbi:hypothetical protein [Streptomyces sp. R33]|uniref:Uncharacterized protein n=1 Tax=Streptomyces sp. R33 TaxID=3238629 RepID=A0AB39XVP7_9ACTN